MRLLFAVQKQLVKIESPLQEGGKLKLMLWQMAGNASEFAESQTPKRACLRIPTGHVVVNSKWRNSIFVSVLQGATITYEENLGYLDFQPASQIGIVYATEADLECQASLKRKLVKLRKANEVQVVVLAEKTALSSQYYPALQKFVAMELGFQITPVPSQREADGLVSQIVRI
ncbi:Non-canonical poly(A) RNA polymerase papd5 [Mactra antiquata]